MFNYIKETIINDQNNVVKDGTVVRIKRGGNYDCDKILDGKIYKTVGYAGVKGTITIDVSKFTSANIDYRQFAIFIGASEKLSDYALANWAEFGKPVLVESAATTAADLASALKLALPNDNPLYTVAVSGTTVVLTLAESWMSPVECSVYEHNSSTDALVKNTTAVSTTANKVEFGTAKWIVENLRFPSYPNVRYNALYSDEAPVRGTIYNQYSFQYVVKHATPGGLSGVGQVVDSITTHVFYVPAADATAFEGKFSNVTLETGTDKVSSMDGDATRESVSNEPSIA